MSNLYLIISNSKFITQVFNSDIIHKKSDFNFIQLNALSMEGMTTEINQASKNILIQTRAAEFMNWGKINLSFIVLSLPYQVEEMFWRGCIVTSRSLFSMLWVVLILSRQEVIILHKNTFTFFNGEYIFCFLHFN